jgi:hypothetical protein
MSKRKVTVVWFEVNLQGQPRAFFFRTRRNNDNPNLPMAYTPSQTSSKRLNRVARDLSRSAFQPFTCEVSAEPDIMLGWSLIREERLYIPPPMGTKRAGQPHADAPR